MKICPICRSTLVKNEFEVKRVDPYMECLPPGQRIPARYRECLDCETMYLSVPNISDDSYVNGGYYNVDAGSPDFFLKRFKHIVSLPKGKSDNLERVARIKSFIHQRGLEQHTKLNVLDIGAGLGVFLAQFLEPNWDGSAVEPDQRSSAHIKSVLPAVEVFAGPLQSFNSAKKFDLITLNRMLEHVEHPLEVLGRCAHLLSKNGYLYLELPDTKSFYDDSANNEAFGYGHYAVYSPQGIRKLAHDSDFEVADLERVKEPSTKYTIYAFLKRKKAK